MLSRIRREGQKLAVNGTGVNALQSLSFGYETTAAPISTLGLEKVIYAPNSPQTASIQANSLMVYDDFFVGFTGELPFSGQIEYKNEKVEFTEAYLTSYSSSCSIGEIPSTSMSAEIYGEMGTGNYVDFDSITPHDTELKIAGYNSISIDLDEAVSNRVNSYSIDIQSPRTPVYAFNDKTPSEVVSDSPLNVTLQFSIDADDYKIKNMRFVPEETVFKNVNVEINKNNSAENIKTFSFDNMLLVSEQYQSDNNGNVEIDFTLVGTILRN